MATQLGVRVGIQVSLPRADTHSLGYAVFGRGRNTVTLPCFFLTVGEKLCPSLQRCGPYLVSPGAPAQHRQGPQGIFIQEKGFGEIQCVFYHIRTPYKTPEVFRSTLNVLHEGSGVLWMGRACDAFCLTS